jgi:hypothetical protein
MTPTAPDRLEALRAQVATAIQRGTDLIADLHAVSDGFALVMPSLAELTEQERLAALATICGFEPALNDRLRDLVEGLADALAGLTTADRGEAWLRRQIAALETGGDVTTG